ncbi:MAG: phosphoglycerate mutase family protein [bacterium]|nr:phosphoglycerate mutase family protein [bacterium]
MLITLIRHSKTKLEKDIPNVLWNLTEEGVELAQQLSLKQEIKDVNVLYSSLQTKALHTSILLAKDNYIPLKTNPDLTELTSITQNFIENFESEVKKLYYGETERINEGESIKEGLLRFNHAIEEIVKVEKDASNIGIVAHGNILSIFSAQFIDMSPYEIHYIIKMPDIAILDWDSKKFIKFFGDLS